MTMAIHQLSIRQRRYNKNYQFQILLLTRLLLEKEMKTVSQNHKCMMSKRAPKGLNLKKKNLDFCEF